MALPPETQAIVPQQLKSLHPQKIAVIRRNGLGDLLMTMPLLIWCKRYLSNHILLIVDSRNAECAHWIDNPPWEELWVMDRGNKYISAWHLVRKLRQRHLDLVLGAKPTPMNLMTASVAFSGARVRRVVTGCQGWSRLIEKKINWPISEQSLMHYEHQAEQVLHLLCENHIEISEALYPRMRKAPEPWFQVFEEICKQAGMRIENGVKRLYINLTNNRSTSRLELQHVVRALRTLNHPLHLVLGALPADQEVAEQWQQTLTRELGWPAAIAIGRELPFTLAAIQACDGVLTGDGGLMHLAAACDKPQLALFGQTCVKKWRPLSKKAVCLHHPQAVSCLSIEALSSGLKTMLLSSF